jgi:FtsZ-binding cell division protein ZapB
MQLPAYVEYLRKEVRLLRIHNDQLQRSRIHTTGKIAKLEMEIKQLKRNNKELEREKKRLEKEEEKLKQKIEKISKTNNRYQIALFDHGNFKHKDGDTEKKKKGGQKGHADTNREKTEDYSSYKRKRAYAKTCGNCNNALSRVSTAQQKILLDIVMNPELIKMIILSERQWCDKCKRSVIAKDPQSLPFTEYGINTFMMTMILRFSCHSSMGNISKVLLAGYGLTLSKSDIANLLKSSAKYLGKHYEDLKKEIRNGRVMYNDETGWLVHGQKAWMWIMSNEEATVYVAAESRGKGIFEEMYGDSKALSMHDGYASYESITGVENTAYCWTHVLRFAYEETVKLFKDHLACNIRDRLVDLYKLIRLHTEWTREQKEQSLRNELDSILAIESLDETVKNIQHRVKTQKEGLILALLETPDGTNNLSERELRNMAIKRNLSYGSDTYLGMENTAIIGSVMQTLHRNKDKPFIPTLKTYLQTGMQEKYQQYIHTAYYDS